MAERRVQRLASIVGACIASRRKQKGLTQAEFAERLGMGADSLSRIEKGVVAPRFPRLEQIAAYLECTVADLFREPDEGSAELLAAIAEAFKRLPSEKQRTVAQIVADLIRVVGVDGN